MFLAVLPAAIVEEVAKTYKKREEIMRNAMRWIFNINVSNII